ncbi:hypothetical protein HYALB_00003336 [Hymenoscyphus albidus]|uniref:CAP-Gly domain-containing protein n=1 Tax=Hymenoscyphus albidus TaxID=595503 RepID=A0A9N9Q2D8_9HELO|nr:hypothetical protein HYALB_00003336 [Hymenoscyphus albidus]
MATQTTPRRQLRPRQVNSTASSPNLNSAYIAQAELAKNPFPSSLSKKISLSALTPNSLATTTTPNGTKGYGVSTVPYTNRTTSRNMAPTTPSYGDGDDLEVGDTVDVPGNMYGVVKFVGTVQGKKGLFAGVELCEEFARRGKNNGDVEGVSYFQTQIPGAGIFLPINRATRRASASSRDESFPLTPSTPSAGSSFKARGQSATFTPPTPSLPNFSKSVGAVRAPSPGFKKTRPSLSRPESPLRKPQLSAFPTIHTPGQKVPPRYGSPVPTKFGQSVGGTADSGDPRKRGAYPGRNGMSTPGTRSVSALGQTPMSISEDDTTPIGVGRTPTNGSLGSVSSFASKMRPASRAASRTASRTGYRVNNEDEVDRLRGQLEEREKQLKDQAASLAEMEGALAEVQSLMGAAEVDPSRNNRRGSVEDKDASQLRMLLREKNEKIAMLTAEFDAHRADFRSTIDTLELASTETERVYEKRVEDLLHEVREYQDRTDDVDSVARQLKQLEELVQELEEGLEDARRGEAEARGEVEFLRGEVERTRSELRREREKAAAVLNGNGANGESKSSSAQSKELAQRDDEIRGLKAIIHSLSRDAIPDTSNPPSEFERTPTQRQGSFPGLQGSISGTSSQDIAAREKMERELRELRAVVEAKTSREDELERELERARRGSAGQVNSQRSSAMTLQGSGGIITQDYSSGSARDSKGTIASWRERDLPRSSGEHQRKSTLDTMPESDTYSSATESNFCELCETTGHDILTCTNMFTTNGNGKPRPQNELNVQKRTSKDAGREGLNLPPQDYKPAPLSPMKRPPPPVEKTPTAAIPNPMESGPCAGKESGVINMDKWCGVCEREGHDSIDCPFEDAF